MICKYKNGVLCEYLTKHKDNNGFYVNDNYCRRVCLWGENKEAIVARSTPITKQSEEHKKQIEAAIKDLPSNFQMSKNLRRHVVQIAKYYKQTKRMYVSDEIEQERLEVCRNCPGDKMIIKDGVMRCTLQSCGCYLDNPKGRKILDGKARYEALDCDLKHWPKIEPKQPKTGGKE